MTRSSRRSVPMARGVAGDLEGDVVADEDGLRVDLDVEVVVAGVEHLEVELVLA